MVQQRRAGRLKAWLNRQALPQADGSYLIRPFGRSVYQVDAETKDLWVAFRLGFSRFMLIAAVGFLRGEHRHTRGLAVGLLGRLCAHPRYGGYGGPLIILRRSRRVPRTLWTGPAIIDADDRFPRWFYLCWAIVSVPVTVLCASLVWFDLRGEAKILWPMLPVTLLMAACAVFFVHRYRRTAPKNRGAGT